MVSDYRFEQNDYNDQQFMKNSLARNERHELETIIAADGAYDGQEIQELAQEKNTRVMTTALSGSLPDKLLLISFAVKTVHR